MSCDVNNPVFTFAVIEETEEEECMVLITSDPTMAVSIHDIVKKVSLQSGSVSSLIGGRFSH